MDEHGAKIVEEARKKGINSQDLCDEMSTKFKETWKLLNISYTDFIRTTEKRHFVAVEKAIKILFDNGFIFKKKYTGLYCVGCERFYVHKDLDEDSCCHFHKTRLVMQSEENYFFKLSYFEEALLERVTNISHSEYMEIKPEERKNEIIGKLKLGLEDVSFSRALIEWGIPLPFDKKQTVYVWMDALINYITGIGYPENKIMFQKYWPADVHLMAKDILWFHSIIWPAILMGLGLPVPKKIYSHGFFTLNGSKMSKSLGNIISPQELVEKYGVDASRYLVITLIPFDSDCDISWSGFTLKYNTDLANNLGNLISRTTKMAEKCFVQNMSKVKSDLKLAKEVAVILKESFISNMDSIQFNKAAEVLQIGVTFINRRIETDAPWRLAKTEKDKFVSCISSYLQAISVIAIHLLPFMPKLSEKIWRIIGANGDINEVAKKYFSDFIVPKNDLSIYFSQQRKVKEIVFPRIVV
jgi:methionyl-tRNA synthetase